MRNSSNLLMDSDFATRQTFDLSEKIEHSGALLGRESVMLGLETQGEKPEDKLAKATSGGRQATIKAIPGLVS